jgi:hypothetical protein
VRAARQLRPRDVAARALDGVQARVRHVGQDLRHLDHLMNGRLRFRDLKQAALAASASRRESIDRPGRLEQVPLVALVTRLPTAGTPGARSLGAVRPHVGRIRRRVPELREFSPSLASSSATRAFSRRFSDTSSSTRPSSALTCASSAAIRWESDDMHREDHVHLHPSIRAVCPSSRITTGTP